MNIPSNKVFIITYYGYANDVKYSISLNNMQSYHLWEISKYYDYLYLGSYQQYYSIFKSKVISPDNIQNIYISPKIQYPRVNLSILGIKRSLSEDKATASIIDTFEDNDLRKSYKEITPIIFYSKSEDKYYVFSSTDIEHNYPDTQKQWDRMCSKIVIKSFCDNDRLNTIISAGIYLEIIPSDIVLFYQGEIYPHNYDILNVTSIIPKNKFDDYINTFMPKIDEEIISNIDDMLQSRDANNVELGVKLLCGYNIDEFKLRIGFLLYKNKGNIRYAKAYKSVQFKYLLSKLNISELQILELYQIYDHIGKTGVTEKDSIDAKLYIKNLILTRVNHAIYKYQDALDVLNLKFNYQFE